MQQIWANSYENSSSWQQDKKVWKYVVLKIAFSFLIIQMNEF